MKQYFLNFLVLLDEGVNTVFGGDPSETISSRAGKYAVTGKGWFPCQLCKLLNLFQKDHCIKSIDPNEGKNAVMWEKQ